MTRKITLALAIAVIASFPTLRAATAPVPASLDERIILVEPAGREREDQEIRKWQMRVRAETDKKENFERLGWAYVAKARRTLDAGYYKLAEKTAEAMEARFGQSPDSSLLRGHVLHNLHHFKEAEAVARQLVASRGLAFDYALLSDACMEQGKLTEAVAACQHEMSLRPGIEAYSRAANLRWLTGDLPGAIQAMDMAVRSTSPLDAADCAWTLSRLSSYALQAGQAPRALLLADSASGHIHDYPPALLARGRALLALGRTADALFPLERAEKLNPLPEYQWWLADALRAGGRTGEAARLEDEIRSRGEAADRRTTSLFLATRKEDSSTALRLAREEMGERADVFTHDSLAWALSAAGDNARAEVVMREALAARTKDARLFLHAGEIALALGHTNDARAYYAEAAPYSATLTPGERALLDHRNAPGAALARSD